MGTFVSQISCLLRNQSQNLKMWWEVLPSLTIVMAGLYLPMAITGVGNLLHKKGKYTARFWQDGPGINPDWVMYSRDLRITGSEYIPKGLESIPDEPASK